MKITYKNTIALLTIALAAISNNALAVPTLQVGVSDGAGGYIAYTPTGTSPTEADTAFTSGNAIVVGGAYGPNDLLIGGKYTEGFDWSSFGFDTSFNMKGSVLMASVSNFSTALTIDGFSSFYTSTGFDLFPNNHAPLGDASAFLFFDIGNFAKYANMVTDFSNGDGPADGELKSLMLGGTSSYDWIHFDVMALVTDTTGKTHLTTSLENNPGSHDVTWKNTSVPEPATVLLLGLGLGMMGMLITYRERSIS